LPQWRQFDDGRGGQVVFRQGEQFATLQAGCQFRVIGQRGGPIVAVVNAETVVIILDVRAQVLAPGDPRL
jgi:hypothetical protein